MSEELFSAIESRNMDRLQALLADPDTNVNAPDRFGNTALIWAATRGNKRSLELLLAREDLVINVADRFGRIPLLWAAQTGHQGLLDGLLARKDVVISGAEHYGKTPLLWAAQNGYQGLLDSLLQHRDQDINAADNYGKTALHWVAEQGDKDLLHSLLARQDLDINAADKFGNTALICALRNPHEGVLPSLLARKDVVINAADSFGRTVLLWVAEHRDKGLLDSVLARADVDTNVASSYGWTALMLAVMQGNQGKLDSLLAHQDVDVDFVNFRGVTALMCAIYPVKNQDTIRKLLAMSVDADLDVAKLMVAARFGGDLPALKDQGIDIHVTGPGGWTALMHAADAGKKDAVEFLLKDCEKINAVNKNGFSALMLAVENEHDSVVGALKASVADLDFAKLMVAAHSGDFSKVKEFEKQGHKIYHFDEAQTSEDDLYAAKVALKSKDQVKTYTGQGPGGWTVLMHATRAPEEFKTKDSAAAICAEEFIRDYFIKCVGTAEDL